MRSFLRQGFVLSKPNKRLITTKPILTKLKSEPYKTTKEEKVDSLSVMGKWDNIVASTRIMVNLKSHK